MNAIGKTFCELVSIIKILIPWRGEPENMSRDDDLVADQISKQCGFSMNRSNDEDEYNVHQSGSETRHQVNSYYAQVDSDGITETDDSDKVHPGREENAKVSPKKHGFDTHNLKGTQTIGKNEDEPDICDENEVAPSVYVDFENNGLLWLPPEPEDEEDERETILFDDDDDDDYGNVTEEYHYRDRLGKDHNKFMKDAFNGHFRALITQHLEVENLLVKDNDKNSWLEIITALSWEVATLLKPDMSRGGGMDPASYVKIKCIACGSRIESTVVKGVVCTKNVAHRQMTSRMDKPRLLIIAGALEYQHGTNVISSVDTLLQQEMDHMKMVVGKIAAYNPDVLLVEKRVSRYVHMYLLEKGISMALNVKRHLLERIARCTGTQIVPSIDHLSSRKLGYCEKFHVEKFVENLSSGDGLSKKTTAKTLMFFEGCPRPMGFTILLRGADEDELKKVKRVVQYGVFAAYNLALETSFLADERASPLPEFLCTSEETREDPKQLLVPNISVVENTVTQYQPENPEIVNEEKNPTKEEFPLSPFDQQSILVSLSSWCAWKGTVCERSHLFRIKYYGNFDIPLGRFLRDNLFDEANRCYSCEMPSESHVHCYTHLHGTLTISVKKLPEMILPGERDGNIWIWHRCLRCPRTNGIPPATRRIVMSDAAWGLSFGKFLELSFSNHAATSRVASCGHSLHRDCLRFYGFGKMVACFRYASINVHSVYLPSYKLEFEYGNQNWIQKELDEVVNKAKLLFSEVLNALGQIEEKISSAVPVSSALKTPELRSQVAELEDMLQKEKVEFEETLQKILNQEKSKGQHWIDILEVNQLMRHLVSQSYIWDNHLTHVASGARLQHSLFWKSSKYIMPIGVNDTVIPVYDDEPSSIIAYSLLSPQYSAQLTDQKERPKHEVVIDSQRNFGSVEDLMSDNHNSSILDPMLYTKAMHAIVSFEEDSPHGKVKYSVTCYYAKQFEALRRICCSSELDYIRSLSRCEKLEPKGGKNNVFFSRTLDDRFIIKQITKTEVESFIKFGPDYFKYLTESIVSRSPTCMAKILGIYQVKTKHIKGGKESKMDVLIMENVLFKRTVTRIYDLKGYSRSRYNQDSSGSNKVLLDQNLIEAMPTSPIYVGNKAKRLLERAIWNDTAFLASIDVMDYSLLVGVDEEKHELVIGIIDFMRKYTWVTHLETWTSGIIGWSKNVSPTVMSPMQYKKRFRKAISTYFLMLPDSHS